MPEELRIIKGSASRIRTIRLKLKLTQSQMASRLGVAPNTVARWERGDLVPPKVAELAAEHLLLVSKKGEASEAKKR